MTAVETIGAHTGTAHRFCVAPMMDWTDSQKNCFASGGLVIARSIFGVPPWKKWQQMSSNRTE